MGGSPHFHAVRSTLGWRCGVHGGLQDQVGPPCDHVPWSRKGRRRIGDVLVKKQALIEWLVRNGDEAAAFDIEGSHFPQEVDTDTDRELLAQYRIDVDSLLGRE
jgi:hypothetical protein